MMIENFTIPSEAFDITNISTFNPDCIKDLQVLANECTDFRVKVIDTIDHRLRLCIFLLVGLLLLKTMLDYSNFAFVQSEFYQRQVKHRLDYLIIIVAFAVITLMFV